MKYKHCALYFVLVIISRAINKESANKIEILQNQGRYRSRLVMAEAAPPHHSLMPACLGGGCDSETGPVCVIDASGLPRTFESNCMAKLEFCRYGTYFAEVKPGEC